MALRNRSSLWLSLALSLGASGCNAVLGLDELPLADAVDAGDDAVDAQTDAAEETVADAPADSHDASDTNDAEASIDAGPDTAPDASPDVTTDVTPDASEDVLGDVAPDVAPDLTADVTPDAIDDVIPDAAPDASPDATADVTPDAMDDVLADVAPDVTPDTIADVALDVSPDVIPDVTGDVIPDVTADTADSALDGGTDGGSSSCSDGGVSCPPSCAGGLTCMVGGSMGTPIDCCDSKSVPGGTFPMGRSTSGTDACPTGFSCDLDEVPEHAVTVPDFRLDTLEVTVGRFRKFVAAYGTPIAVTPADGAGAGPNGGGWQSRWNVELPADEVTLRSRITAAGCLPNWTNQPASNEQLPINCVDWYTAFAFCIWDGGRLPSAPEWEYAAAGGSDDRLYPWGAADPTSSLASACLDVCTGNFLPVGSRPAGLGRWGHLDLAGNVWEWTRDDFVYGNWYEQPGADTYPCNQGWVNLCADNWSLDQITHVIKGGDATHGASFLRAVDWQNWQQAPGNDGYPRDPTIGFRCAR